jgi:hypothetical protein
MKLWPFYSSLESPLMITFKGHNFSLIHEKCFPQSRVSTNRPFCSACSWHLFMTQNSGCMCCPKFLSILCSYVVSLIYLTKPTVLSHSCCALFPATYDACSFLSSRCTQCTQFLHCHEILGSHSVMMLLVPFIPGYSRVSVHSWWKLFQSTHVGHASYQFIMFHDWVLPIHGPQSANSFLMGTSPTHSWWPWFVPIHEKHDSYPFMRSMIPTHSWEAWFLPIHEKHDSYPFMRNMIPTHSGGTSFLPIPACFISIHEVHGYRKFLMHIVLLMHDAHCSCSLVICVIPIHS